MLWCQCPCVCDVCALWSQGVRTGSRISLHAWIDGCLCYLLTMPHPDRRMGWCRDFWWKWGGMEKLVIVVISVILLTESLDRKHVTCVYVYVCWLFYNRSYNLGRKCIISEERFVLELPTSCAMLATARPLVVVMCCCIVDCDGDDVNENVDVMTKTW